MLCRSQKGGILGDDVSRVLRLVRLLVLLTFSQTTVSLSLKFGYPVAISIICSGRCTWLHTAGTINFAQSAAVTAVSMPQHREHRDCPVCHSHLHLLLADQVELQVHVTCLCLGRGHSQHISLLCVLVRIYPPPRVYSARWHLATGTASCLLCSQTVLVKGVFDDLPVVSHCRLLEGGWAVDGLGC